MKNSIRIVEVGLRDGLQNEKVNLSLQERIDLANRLCSAGVTRMELGAFVRPDIIPQMAISEEVVSGLKSNLKIQGSVLVPNEHGMNKAVQLGVKEVAIFTGASETFVKKNINCSIEESINRFKVIAKIAKAKKIKIRGYISTCFGCPYEGAVDENKVVEIAVRLLKLGCYEISIGDTIGVATPKQVESLFKKLKRKIPVKKLAGHFHDTRSTSLVNILQAYRLGVTVFDASICGLGGCPYAPGSAGNVATEDVVYMFGGMGIKTGLNLNSLIETNKWLSQVMKKELPSKVGKAGLSKACPKIIE